MYRFLAVLSLFGMFYTYNLERFTNTMLKDSGMLVIPSVPSNEGRFIGFPGLISKFCRSLVKNRKSSILAGELLKHILRPVKINQFENPSIISTFKIYLKYLCS